MCQTNITRVKIIIHLMPLYGMHCKYTIHNCIWLSLNLNKVINLRPGSVGFFINNQKIYYFIFEW